MTALWKLLALFALAASAAALILYGSDKARAGRGGRRIPEATLLGAGLLFGAAGALLGMNLFRHKTKHWYFWAVNVPALLAQLLLLTYLYLKGI